VALPASRGDAPLRTVVLLELANRPGALVRVLLPFADRGVDLTRIESRPTGDPWTYRFLLELRVDVEDPAAQSALEEARGYTSVLKVLGCFPMAV